MTSNPSGERIQQLFLDASRLAVGDRDEWLRAECAGDDQLLDNVRSLLSYDDLVVDPLESGLPFPDDLPTRTLSTEAAKPIVPGYRVVRELGTGGQAIVFEAIQESTTQRVALKMLRWGPMASTQERERLRREMLILARLSHPGIVSIIDSGETATGVFFIATKFVDGPSLNVQHEAATSAAQPGRDSQSEDQQKHLQLFVKVCDAVAAAHAVGVVHRDLKPANILIDELGEPRVLDFGLAKPSNVDWSDTSDGVVLTRSGQFMGSLPWASPEQAAGDRVDVRSDVYSLGVILYQLLSGGQFPYDVSGSMPEVISNIMHADPTPLVQVARDTRQRPMNVRPRVSSVDERHNSVVLKALAKSRDERYQTAGELSKAVAQILVAQVENEPREIVARPCIQNVLIAVAVSVALSIVACSIAVLGPFSNADRIARHSSSPSSSDTSVETDWKSFDQALSELSDADSITKTNEGWRIRGREIQLRQLRSDNLIVRTVLRRHTADLLTLRFLSPDGGDVTIHLARNDGNDADDVSLLIEGKGFVEGQIQCLSDVEAVLDVSVALLPDRVSVGIDGQVWMQFHTQLQGQWTPVLDASSADIDCITLQYCQPAASPSAYAVDVVPMESAMIDYVLKHGGAAFSQLIADSADSSTFHITSLNTDGNPDGLPAHVVDNLVRCSQLYRLKIAQMTDPVKAMKRIASLKTLTILGIADCRLDDDCVHYIAELDQLRSLVLSDMHSVDSDLLPLQRLAALEILDTSVTVSDAQLEQLTKVKSLRTILANGSAITSKG